MPHIADISAEYRLIRADFRCPADQFSVLALTSALRWSAEEHVAEDWAAVANAINSRAEELQLKQKELSERSGVSLAIVREIQQNRIHRQRSPRTLEALSIALEWHPQYLSAVLRQSPPPVLDSQVSRRDDPVVVLLETVVKEIRGLRAQVGALTKRIDNHVTQDQVNESDTR